MKTIDQTFHLSYAECRRLRRRSRGAQQRDQSEICGLLCVSGARSLTLHFLKNEALQAGSWRLGMGAIRLATRHAHSLGLRVLGLFHSHPISWATPGDRDRQCITPRRWQLIYDVCGREAKLWRKDRHGNLREVKLTIERTPNRRLQPKRRATKARR